MTPDRHSFTMKASAIQNRLVSPCWVYESWAPVGDSRPPPRREYNALWDTGATHCMITERVVDELALQVEGNTVVHHVQGYAPSVPIYYVNLALLESLHFPAIRVFQGELLGTDVLIGMDIINRGDFAVSNRNGATTFSFRVPSVESFDFVEQDEEHTQLSRAQESQPT